jgi:hypothetical protein
MAIENLIPFNELTEEEQRALASKGGKASVEARRRKRTLKEELLLLLEEADNQKNISVAMLKQAMEGNVKAFEVIRDTVGEKPKDVIDNNVTFDKSPVNELIESIESIKNASKD